MEPHYYGYLLMRLRNIDLLNLHVQWNLTNGYLLMRLRNIDLLNLHVQWNLTITVTYSWDYATLTFLIYMWNEEEQWNLTNGYLLMRLRNIDLLNLHADLGRFRIRNRNQRTNLNPNPDLIPDSESYVVESDLESESCRFESDSDS